MLFNIALNYGGRAEIIDAARRMLTEGVSPDELDERRFSEYLYTAGQPDPDLLIRTSGEMRVSNFLLWQIAYSEIWVTETLWPDFRRRHLLEAVVAYQKRDRRHGGIKQPRWRSASSDTGSERRRPDSDRHCGGMVCAAVGLSRWRSSCWCWGSRIRDAERASGLEVPPVAAGAAAMLTCAAFAQATTGAGPGVSLDVVLMSALVALGGLTLVGWKGGRDAIANAGQVSSRHSISGCRSAMTAVARRAAATRFSC
jgi:hypothetical protein